MAKLALLFALCLLPALAASRHLGPPFQVRGRVYCDTCRFGFETPVSTYLAGAEVKIECRDKDSLQLKYTAKGVTDLTGTYHITVNEDRYDDLCDVLLVRSPKVSCAKADPGRDKARVVLTNANGVLSNTRHANNMGFLLDQPLGLCSALRKEYLLDGADARTFWRI